MDYNTFDYKDLEALQINKDQLPYSFDIRLGAEVYTFEVRHNALLDIFTFDLSNSVEKLVNGEPIIYGLPLFENMRDSRYPPMRILPWNTARDVDAVTFDNLDEDVKLYISDALADYVNALGEAKA